VDSDQPDDFDVRNIVDLTYESEFQSNDEPGQWICWDFQDMLVCATHYAIKTEMLKSWVIETSLDGANWTERDQKTETKPYSCIIVSFGESAEFRFVRVTQTGINRIGYDRLLISAFEVFGTLLERHE
jgi:hypothetical protein